MAPESVSGATHATYAVYACGCSLAVTRQVAVVNNLRAKLR